MDKKIQKDPKKTPTATSEEPGAKAGYYACALCTTPPKGWEKHLSHPSGPTPEHTPTLTPYEEQARTPPPPHLGGASKGTFSLLWPFQGGRGASWCVQGAWAVPCLCSRLFRSGSWVFWSFCIFLSIICPSCACTQLFLVPFSFFVICSLRRHLSRCKHCSRGSQVPPV